jgi:citrate lyase beta subunit
MDHLDAYLAELHLAHLRHRATVEQVRGLHSPHHRRGVMAIPAFKMAPGGDPAVDGRAQSLKLMAGAQRFAVDSFFFDLEDAAPDRDEFKAFARQFAIEALRTGEFGRRVVGFRPNNLRTAFFERDLAEVLLRAGHKLDVVVLPKSESASEVADVAQMIRQGLRLAGVDRPVALEVLIESPRAFAQAQQIAAVPGVSALVYGAFDMARCIGAQVRPDRWLDDHRTVRQLLPVLAAAEGKEALDAVTAAIPVRPARPASMSTEEYTVALQGDLAVLAGCEPGFARAIQRRQEALEICRRESQDARAIGFAGKWVLHPDQIAPIQDAWQPTRDEALRALHVVADYARAAMTGSGARLHGQQMADKAVIGALWWEVQDAARAKVLQDADFADCGATLDQMRRAVVTRDQQLG